MSLAYKTVGWNPQKKAYDRVLVGGIVVWPATFLCAGAILAPAATIEMLLLRATGTLAIALLHVVLAIGPLTRIDARFLPLLYNRRHLGVATFGAGAVHGVLALVQFHALGNVSPLVSLLTSETRFESLHHFPFHVLGAFGLLVLFLMAATSHDFWLANLSPRVWKSLHMMVYVAWAALVMHVALGVLQAETSPWFAAVLGLACAAILAIHLVAARRETRADREPAARARAESSDDVDTWIDAGDASTIPLDRARVMPIAGERVAIFRHANGLSAISNVCRHQGGPLGEGRIVNGCVTCPWHGYQYLVENGRSPPPFTEQVETYRVAVRGGRVRVDPRALPPGTALPPAQDHCAGDLPREDRS